MNEDIHRTKKELITELSKLRIEVEQLSSHILNHSTTINKNLEDNEFNFDLPEAIFEVDMKGCFLNVNNAALKLFGFQKKDMRKLNVLRVLDPKDHERAKSNLNKITFNKDLGSNEYTGVKSDGTKFPIIIHSAPLKKNNITVGIRGVIVDITKVKSVETLLRKNNKQLEDTVSARTKQLEETNAKLLRSVEQTIKALAQTVAQRDPYTANHQKRVAHLAHAIAVKMELSAEQIKCIYLSGIIHDIGKIHIPSEILCKPTKLTELEFELIKTHSERGYDILQNIELPWPIDQTLFQHHEKLDGSGYPRGLKNDEILLEAKILTVADIVEAVSSHRPYRPALGTEVGLQIIKEGQNTLFDPLVVDTCHSLFLEDDYQFIK